MKEVKRSLKLIYEFLIKFLRMVEELKFDCGKIEHTISSTHSFQLLSLRLSILCSSFFGKVLCSSFQLHRQKKKTLKLINSVLLGPEDNVRKMPVRKKIVKFKRYN